MKLASQNNDSIALSKLLQIQDPSLEIQQSILSRLQKLAFFNQFIERFLKGTQKETLLNLCSCFKMEHFKGGQLLFKEGDKSNDKLYIIYNGQVALMRQKSFQTFQQEPQSDRKPSLQEEIAHRPGLVKQSSQFHLNKIGVKTLIINKGIQSKILAMHENKESQQISQPEQQALNQKYGETVRVLQSGDGFGELALIENKPRALTAVAFAYDTFMLILKKDDFEVVKQQFVQSMKEKRQLIFSKFQVQNAYSTALLEALAYSFDVDQFACNTVLTEDGGQSKQFYLIQNGEVILERYVQNHVIKICILTKGQFVGEEIVFNQDSSCNFNAKVISQTATLMVINLAEFNIKFPTECKNQLKIEYQQKQRFRTDFQKQTFENVSDPQIQLDKPKKMFQIKINRKAVRSDDKKHTENQDIDKFIEDIKDIYHTKYHEYQKSGNYQLISPDIKIRMPSTPRYVKQDKIFMKAFKQRFVRKFKKTRSSWDLQSMCMTVRTQKTIQTFNHSKSTSMPHDIYSLQI